LTSDEVEKVENLIREVIPPEDLGIIVSNIGVTPGFSSIYTTNSAQHTATIQVGLQDEHRVGTYDYIDRIRARIGAEYPHLVTYFSSGGIVDAVVNLGLPAPIDVQVSGSNMEAAHRTATELAARIREIPGVADTFVPQDIDYPSLKMDIDRGMTSRLGLSPREVVSNIITSLVSNQMIAPSYWVDHQSGNDYMLTVQYPEGRVRSMVDLASIPLRSPRYSEPTRLGALANITSMEAPTEVDHYQLRRVVDVYVGLKGEDLGRVASEIDRIIAGMKTPEGVRVNLRGMVHGMRSSFRSFGFGLLLSVVLLYLILIAQFRSFIDPLIILLAVPPGITGVLCLLYAAGTTLNVQSLMGVVMMVGIVVSNSILIVEFAHRLIEQGLPLRDAVAESCRVRLRPVLMTSLATIIGLAPMALKLGTGSESYAPLAQAIIGGLTVSVVVTVFLVPAALLVIYRGRILETA
jgi:multidrug efflux pump subunit AcrB